MTSVWTNAVNPRYTADRLACEIFEDHDIDHETHRLIVRSSGLVRWGPDPDAWKEKFEAWHFFPGAMGERSAAKAYESINKEIPKMFEGETTICPYLGLPEEARAPFMERWAKLEELNSERGE